VRYRGQGQFELGNATEDNIFGVVSEYGDAKNNGLSMIILAQKSGSPSSTLLPTRADGQHYTESLP